MLSNMVDQKKRENNSIRDKNEKYFRYVYSTISKTVISTNSALILFQNSCFACLLSNATLFDLSNTVKKLLPAIIPFNCTHLSFYFKIHVLHICSTMLHPSFHLSKTVRKLLPAIFPFNCKTITENYFFNEQCLTMRRIRFLVLPSQAKLVKKKMHSKCEK